jgi:sodium/proline symporter
MDANTLILLTFGGYLVLLLGIGWWGDRRFGKSYAGFVTADKSLGGWVAAISAAASAESAWVMLGLSGLGYSKGVAAYWATTGCALGSLATSLFVVVQLRRSSGDVKILTLGDYLEHLLGDRRHLIKAVSSLLIGFFLLVYVVAQFVGTGKQMEGMKLMGYHGGVIIGAAVIGIYVLIGGYAAVCWTDMIQGILMTVVLVAFPLVALGHAGGLEGVNAALAKAGTGSLWVGGQGLSWAAAGFALGQMGIGVGYPGMPHVIIRFITVRDDRAARKAAVISVVVVSLMLFGAATLGVVGRALVPELSDPEHILPTFTARFFHPAIGGVILAAVTAAIMSTADSQLMMAATAVLHDLYYPLVQRQAPEGRSMVIQTRAVIGALSLLALGVALIEPQVIYTFVLFAWGALGASFTPVILLSLHWRRLNWQGALACLILGPLTIIAWKLAGLSTHLYELFPGAIVATAAAVVVSLATPPSRARALGRDVLG